MVHSRNAYGRFIPELRSVRVAGAIICTGGTALGVAAAYTAAQGCRNVAPALGAPPALVLGCRPGPALEARVEAAVGLFMAGRTPRLIFSGAGEAHPAAALAADLGVPTSQLQVETTARNTRQNFERSLPLLLSSAVWVVTDALHLPRAMRWAQRLGLSPYACPAKSTDRAASTRARAWFRESVAVVAEFTGG